MCRWKLFSLTVMLSVLVVGMYALTSCSSTPAPPEGYEAPADSGNTDAGPVEKKSNKCDYTADVNFCTDPGKDCGAVRDCSLGKAEEIPGACNAGLSGQKSICVPKPIREGKVEEAKKWIEPDLSCIGKFVPPAGPDKANIIGPVETFGLATDTTGITIEVYLDSDRTLSNAIQTVKSAACPDKDHDKKCDDTGKNAEDSDGNPIGYFELKDIPTNKLIVFRVKGGSGFVTTVQYLLWVPANEVDKDGKYKHRAFIVTELTRNMIPPAAGINRVSDGNSVIAGEIHDCKDRQIQGAKVAISRRPQKLTYFNGDDSPDQDQDDTNTDGIYAALNIDPGKSGDVHISASVKVGAKTISIGTFKARLFPDQISILTLWPGHPPQK